MIPTQASPSGSACPNRVGASVHRLDANWPGLLQPGCPVPSWTQGSPVCLARSEALCLRGRRPHLHARRPSLWERGCVLAGDPCKTTQPAVTSHPLQTSAWRGRSLNGWPGGRFTPTFQSNWRQTGGGGDARESPAY